MAYVGDVGKTSVTKASDKENDEETIHRLRSLLLGSDYEAALKEFIAESDIDRVSAVISEALLARSNKDQSLAKVLSPVLDRAIDESIKENPKRITNVIFPIIGPAIRKAVSSALADMVQTLNQLLSNSLSIKSWSWRYRAWRAGISYGEFVLLKTLKYRVDQVFLIHKETGLLLCDVSHNAATSQDPELVSAMLTAINDFITDSFHKPEQLSIDSIRFGDFTLAIVAGPLAVIAAAIKGTPTGEVSDRLRETIEAVHRQYLQALIKFDGDKNDFLITEPLLTHCLLEKSQPQKARKPWLAYSLLSILLTWAGWNIVNSYQAAVNKDLILNTLQTQPGYLVIDHSSSNDRLDVVLFRSPQSENPREILDRIERGKWQVTVNDTIAPLDISSYLLPHLKTNFKLPYDTTLSVTQSNQLAIAGDISESNLRALSQSELITSNFAGLDLNQANVLPGPSNRALRTNQWHQAVAAIQATRFHFEVSSDSLLAGETDQLPKLIKNLKLLQQTADELGIDELQILITGFADSRGSTAINSQLSEKRARVVRDIINANGINAQLLIAWGAGKINATNLPAKEQRVVTLQVLYPDLSETQKDKP